MVPRFHTYLAEVGVRFHFPLIAASVRPTRAVPTMVGNSVFARVPTPTLTVAEVAVDVPKAFVAVTVHRIDLPS